MSEKATILIDGHWVASSSTEVFQSFNPTTGTKIDIDYPVSNWDDCERILNAAARAADTMRGMPPDSIADFLETFASRIESAKDALVAIAHEETGLPVSPRLADVELPRTTGQLRQAAAAARQRSWSLATIDTKANIRSHYEPLGPVCVFGPNNFPFAFNGAAGGDFAAAIAAGNPVIAKANTSHPGTTRKLAQIAQEAATATKMPTAILQLIYRLGHDDGLKLVSDHRIGATGYTGSRNAGLKLKSAADAVGKPFYAELSSVNPVVIFPGALAERMPSLVDEYVTSGLMGAGQFCTNPGLVLLIDDESSKAFIQELVTRYAQANAGTLLSKSVLSSLTAGVETLKNTGANLLVGGTPVPGNRCAYANTLLHATGDQFLKEPVKFQTEAFGNAALIVTCRERNQLLSVIQKLEGNLTGCLITAKDGSDDEDYDLIAPALATKVGRILNDKMPTGVAVSSAMNHGGPFPATGHPGFTAVGIPASMLRFGKLTCYDAVRAHRLPVNLRDKNPTGSTWRLIDLRWTTDDVAIPS